MKLSSAEIGGLLILVTLSIAAAGCGGGSAPEPAGESAAKPAAPRGGQPTAPSTVAAPAGSARLTGTVRYDGAVPTLKPLDMGADPGCAKLHGSPPASDVLVLGEGKTMANIFVHVKSGLPDARFPTTTEPVVLDQQGCRYSPHVIGIMVGQPLKILNSDGLLHNIHALPEVNKGFNRAMPASVTEAEEIFTKEEFMFKIKCDVHPWMGAFVSVMRHPFFAVTKKDGQFSIANLPAGTYEIEAWHERLGTQQSTVTLADGEAKSLDFVFATKGGGA